MKSIRVLVLLMLLGLVVLPFTVTAELDKTRTVTIVFSEKTRTVHTVETTVEGVLTSEEIEYQEFDRVFPAPESDVVSGLKIFLYREKSRRVRGSKRSIDGVSSRPEPRKIYSSVIPQDKQFIVRGTKGTFNSTEDPEPGVILQGGPGYKADKLEELVDKGTIAMLATGYSPHAPSTAPYNDGVSAIGVPAGYGVVAVDPSVIPLGTRLYVEGYGYAIAADVGGEIDGRQIDLCFNTHQNALRFGRKWVKVHILG
ncbi:MAG: 3D domain-containing protein [bacterium]